MQLWIRAPRRGGTVGDTQTHSSTYYYRDTALPLRSSRHTRRKPLNRVFPLRLRTPRLRRDEPITPAHSYTPSLAAPGNPLPARHSFYAAVPFTRVLPQFAYRATRQKLSTRSHLVLVTQWYYLCAIQQETKTTERGPKWGVQGREQI